MLPATRERVGGTARHVARVMFQLHAAAFVMTSILLMVIWAAVGGSSVWLWWALGPWGLALVAHAWATFALPVIARRS